MCQVDTAIYLLRKGNELFDYLMFFLSGMLSDQTSPYVYNHIHSFIFKHHFFHSFKEKKCLVTFLLCFLEPGKSPSKHIGQNQSASLLLSFVAGVEAPVMVNNRRYGNVYMSVRLPQCLGCLEEPTQS